MNNLKLFPIFCPSLKHSIQLMTRNYLVVTKALLLTSHNFNIFIINFLMLAMLPEFTNIFMLHHQQCGCRCRIQKEDCSDYQTYDPLNCQCNCGTRQDCPTGKQVSWKNYLWGQKSYFAEIFLFLLYYA